MKKREIIDLNNAIVSALELKPSVSLMLGLLHNQTAIKDEITVHETAMKTIREPLKKYDEEFGKKKGDLIRKYGTERNDGFFEIKPLDENFKVYREELKKITEELGEAYKAELEAFEESMKEYNPSLENEVEFKPYKIKKELFADPYNPTLFVIFFNAGIILEE